MQDRPRRNPPTRTRRLAAVSGRSSPVDSALDGDERQAARTVPAKLDEPESNKIDGVLFPKLHLDDPPSTHENGRLSSTGITWQLVLLSLA
jgi:hypothetical protein